MIRREDMTIKVYSKCRHEVSLEGFSLWLYSLPKQITCINTFHAHKFQDEPE